MSLSLRSAAVLPALCLLAASCYTETTFFRKYNRHACEAFVECFPGMLDYETTGECIRDSNTDEELAAYLSATEDCSFDAGAARRCESAYGRISCEEFQSGDWDDAPACDEIYDCDP